MATQAIQRVLVAAPLHLEWLRTAWVCMGETRLGVRPELGFPFARRLFPPEVLLGASGGTWTW